MSWVQATPTVAPPPPPASAAVAAAKAPPVASAPQPTVVVTAKSERPSGDTTLRCKVSALGEVSGCEVASESPAGLGLGASAMRLATQFRVTPARRGGHPVESVVLLPFKFQMASEARPAPAAAKP